MNKTFLGVLISLMLVAPAAAETRGALTSTSTRARVLENLRVDLKTLRAGIKDATSTQERERAWGEFKTMAASTTAQFRKDVENEKNTLQGLIKAKQQELGASLKRIKDEGKKRTVEQIDANFDAINAKRAASFVEALNKLHDILGKISARADELTTAGTDATSARTAIADAESAISTAQTSVSVQTGKTYKIDVTTEVKLRDAVGKTRSALAHDLNQVYTEVKTAREAVRDAIKALRVLTGENNETSTPPASTSTSF